jgi:hypothetical protein
MIEVPAGLNSTDALYSMLKERCHFFLGHLNNAV